MKSATEISDVVITEGFAIVPSVISESFVSACRDSLIKLIQEDESSRPTGFEVDRHMVHNPFLREKIFFEILENPEIIEIVDQLLGSTSILYAFTTSSMPHHGTNYSHRIHVDSPRVIPKYITNVGVMIALDNFTPSNGATWFLPGSGEIIDPPTSDAFFESALQVLPKAGDMVIFNARTWHLGGMNHSSSDRHALTLNFCRSFIRQRFDYPKMIPYDEASQFSTFLRRVLGYQVRVPTSLDEYYLPTDSRLYWPDQG